MEELLFSLDQHSVYFVFFLLLMGGAIGLPIPEDIPLLFAGAAIQQQLAQPLALFLVCYGAVVLGDVVIYFLGRWFGQRLYSKPWFKRHLPPRRLRRIRRGLERQAFLSIIIARHLFYLRSITFFTCGLVRMRVVKFLVADAIAAVISAAIMMSIGYVASEHLESAMAKIGMVKNWTILVLSLVALGVVMHLIVRRYAARTAVSEAGESEGEAIPPVVSHKSEREPRSPSPPQQG